MMWQKASMNNNLKVLFLLTNMGGVAEHLAATVRVMLRVMVTQVVEPMSLL